ncbi:hypothetical protein QYE76_044362 [Lolium multiflorum]|uniref:Uncharacterized protein n=1 Tax=Lolium multiflorum TaxID=4521 RepID=A0AAD8TIM4_LOLMU|nr:hypothetical protein QYE76_044362 [Lolium multiflorum]
MTRASTTARHDLRAPVKLTAAVAPRLHRHHARQLRQCTSNTPRPSLASSRPWNGDDDDDCRSAPRPPPAPIKGELLHSIRARQSLPLLTTALPAAPIAPISPSIAPIASSPPPPVHGASRSRGHPRTRRCYQAPPHRLPRRGAPSRRSPELRRALRPPTSAALASASRRRRRRLLAVGSSPDPTLPTQRTDSMEHYAQTETYELGNRGSLVFERDLFLVSEKLERPPPQFHGVRIQNTPEGERQWMITAELKGSPEPPISERILFSFKAYNWVDGLAHALQEGLARATRQDRRSLRLQRAKKDVTINRLREKIRTLEITVRTQQDQIQEMEEDGEDIQGGDDFLSDDNDFEEDEFTEEEDYEFLEAAEDGIIPIDVDEEDEE